MSREFTYREFSITKEEAKDARIVIRIGEDEFVAVRCYVNDDPDADEEFAGPLGSLVFTIQESLSAYGLEHEGVVEEFFLCDHEYDSYCPNCGLDS